MYQGLNILAYIYYRLLTTLCQLSSHTDDEHMCSARVHACGKVSFSKSIATGSKPLQPCELRNIPLPTRPGRYSCTGTCSIPRQVTPKNNTMHTQLQISDEEHDKHTCDNRMCPMQCQLCKRLCSNADHLHGLKKGELHLCE